MVLIENPRTPLSLFCQTQTHGSTDFMWGKLIDFAMQERTIELAAVLGAVCWPIVSITIRTAYRWRWRRRQTPPPEAETAPPSHGAPGGGEEAHAPDLSALVQDEAFEPESTVRDIPPG